MNKILLKRFSDTENRGKIIAMSMVLTCPLRNVPLSWDDKKAMESITGGGSKAGPVRHILNNYEGGNLREYLPVNSDYLEPGGGYR